MSSAAPTASPAPSQADDNQNSSLGGNTSSNLYLVTFLATLFLLLFVSCAIVLRSFILRRRYQRRLEEALAVGVILTPRSPGSRKKRFGTKPRLYEAYLSDGGQKWDDIMPLSVQPMTSRRRRNKDRNSTANQLFPASPPAVPTPPPPSTAQPSSGWRTLLPQRYCPVVPPPVDTPLAEDPATSPYVRVEVLQVAVLVAMPSPARSRKRNLASEIDGKERALEEDLYEEEEGIPEVVFGVTRSSKYKRPQPRIEREPSTRIEDV